MQWPTIPVSVSVPAEHSWVQTKFAVSLPSCKKVQEVLCLHGDGVLTVPSWCGLHCPNLDRNCCAHEWLGESLLAWVILVNRLLSGALEWTVWWNWELVTDVIHWGQALLVLLWTDCFLGLWSGTVWWNNVCVWFFFLLSLFVTVYIFTFNCYV